MRQYEKKCGRCGGTGIYSERCGGCFNCGGNRAVPGSGIVTVTVYTAEEKATAKLASERYRNARQTVRETAKALREARRLDTHAEWFASYRTASQSDTRKCSHRSKPATWKQP
jgi:hypothetical protein